MAAITLASMSTGIRQLVNRKVPSMAPRHPVPDPGNAVAEPLSRCARSFQETGQLRRRGASSLPPCSCRSWCSPPCRRVDAARCKCHAEPPHSGTRPGQVVARLSASVPRWYRTDHPQPRPVISWRSSEVANAEKKKAVRALEGRQLWIMSYKVGPVPLVIAAPLALLVGYYVYKKYEAYKSTSLPAAVSGVSG